MNTHAISRRAFLRLSSIALGAIVFRPADPWFSALAVRPAKLAGFGRVAVTAIYNYQEPNFRSQRLGILHRDDILEILEIIESAAGPAHNPRWYRLEDGYVHSGSIQRVDAMRLNLPPMKSIPEGGQLGEVTVPYTRSYRKVGTQWTKLYRLYYSSMHWITALGEGPAPGAWYRLTDDLLHIHHMVPAAHIRPVPPEEIRPISTDTDPQDKRIEIELGQQVLTAYEADTPVFNTAISSGVPNPNLPPDALPTDTPTGRFRIQTKMPSRHMGDGRLTSDIEAYELPGVPWVCIFHKDGFALHGTYWHDNFGRRMSHGCVNLRNQDARWLYRWTTPPATAHDWYTRGLGTLLIIK